MKKSATCKGSGVGVFKLYCFEDPLKVALHCKRFSFEVFEKLVKFQCVNDINYDFGDLVYSKVPPKKESENLTRSEKAKWSP